MYAQLGDVIFSGPFDIGGWSGSHARTWADHKTIEGKPKSQPLGEELDTLELENTIFRSDHASNYLILKGTLNKDKQRLLGTGRAALDQPGSVRLRQEWMRGL